MRYSALALATSRTMDEDKWLACCSIWCYLYYSKSAGSVHTYIDIQRAINEGIVLG